MTLQVEDFEAKEAGLSVEDYEGDRAPGSRLNDKTASQLAATDAILTDPTPDGYNRIREELLDPEQRKKFILRQHQIRGVIFEDAMDETLNAVSSPDVSEEEKLLIAQGSALTKDEIEASGGSSLQVLAEEAVASDSGVNETEQSAESRNLMIDSIQQVVRTKRDISNKINELKLGQEGTALDTLTDVAELIVPLAEWNHIDRLLKDVTGEREALLLGNQKAVLFEQIKDLPVEQRALFAERIIRIVEEHEDVVLPDGNDLMSLDVLENMLLENNYSDFERWFDNATSILDVLGVGALARKVVKAPKVASTVKKLEEAEEVAEDAMVAIDETAAGMEARAVATNTEVNPASPSQVVKDVNPEEARKMHGLAMDDTTESAAQGLYGSNKTEAAAKDILPDPEVKDGVIENKVEMGRPSYEEPEHIQRARRTSGHTVVSEDEMGKVVQKLIDGLEDTVGMIHKGNTVMRANLDGTFGITMRFSPRDSGYKTADQAIENALFAFRNYKITEDNLSLYARQGSEWIKTTKEELAAKKTLREEFTRRKKKIPEELKEIDYMVGLDYNYKFDPADLQEADLLQTGNNVVRALESLGSKLEDVGQGSLVQNLLDASSVIHPQIVNAASVAVDRAVGLKKLFVDEFEDFTKFWNKLSKDRRALMTDYINQANFEGLPLTTTDLYSRGFSKKEVDALKNWRRANDVMWHSTNSDMVKTLRAKGFKVLVHNDTDTKLFGVPLGKATAYKNKTVYDPVEQRVVRLSTEEINDLYDVHGGEVIKLGSSVDVEGQVVDAALVRNTSNGGYTRAIYDGEVVLPYRDGYYPVMYDANHFVIMERRLADGEIDRKVIASARNKADADAAVKSYKEAHPNTEVYHRKDRRLEQERSDFFDEGSWSLAQSSGLTSQKIRGERLKDAGVDLHKAGNTNLKDPLQAVGEQIQRLSQRVAMRDYLEGVKKRWLLNYGEHLDLPVDPKTGKKMLPAKAGDIKGVPNAPKKFVLDAKTNFNYINGLENGYINSIDSVYRGVLNSAADWAGEFGLSKLEEASFALSKKNPVQQAKTLAFRLFISGNPARQAIIQRGQMLQLGAINPKYMPQLAQDLVGVDKVRAGLSNNKKYLDLFEEIKDVGILEAVDAHTLTRQDTLRLADLTWHEKARRGAAAPLNLLQKIGFDLAEQDVLLSSYLSHRDMAIKAGRNIKSQRVRDDVLGQARAYTLMMNRAGEMPYSQNTLGFVAQFFSFRHKAFLQPIFNKSLKAKDRVKLLAYTTALFGVDATLLKVGYDAIWGTTEPNELKDSIEDGFLDVAFNTALTLASGQDQAVDLGDLAPTEAYGIGNVFTGMLTTDLGEMIANAPAGSLLFGNNARVTDAFKTGMRYFNVIEDYEDPELETKLSDVVRASASLFSGYSNMFKAQYSLETRQKMSSSGRITDPDVTAVEAVMASFGFQTKTEVGYRETLTKVFGDSSFQTDDVKSWYKELKRTLAKRGTTALEDDMSQRILSEAWRVFGHERPRAVEIIMKEMEKDILNNDYKIFTLLSNKMGFVTEDEMWEMINKLPPGEVRDRLTNDMRLGKEMLNGK